MKMLLTFSFALATLSAHSVHAQEKAYRLLETIPGVARAGESTTFPAYVEGLFNLGIYVVGIAALVMITIGGFWYVTSAGNASQVSTAKSIITDAFLGLFVAIFAWLILNTINPTLTRYEFTGQITSTPDE